MLPLNQNRAPFTPEFRAFIWGGFSVSRTVPCCSKIVPQTREMPPHRPGSPASKNYTLEPGGRFSQPCGAIPADPQFHGKLRRNLAHEPWPIHQGMEPMAGIEPATDGLRNRCSTAELHWLDQPFLWRFRGCPKLIVCVCIRSTFGETLQNQDNSNANCASVYNRNSAPVKSTVGADGRRITARACADDCDVECCHKRRSSNLNLEDCFSLMIPVCNCDVQESRVRSLPGAFDIVPAIS